MSSLSYVKDSCHKDSRKCWPRPQETISVLSRETSKIEELWVGLRSVWNWFGVTFDSIWCHFGESIGTFCINLSQFRINKEHLKALRGQPALLIYNDGYKLETDAK